MTKRRHKSHALGGPNQGLANTLMNSKAKGNALSNGQKRTEKLTLESRTRESDLQELLSNADLANAKFDAEKFDVKLLSSSFGTIISSNCVKEETLSTDDLNAKFGHLLRIPRRPKLGTYQSAEELNSLESEDFLNWRRLLAKLTDENGLMITPFERNLDIWRQLWRVVERSHVIVQVVDARNPLLFRSLDLENFVREVDPAKKCILLVNKADLITHEQISAWREYFQKEGIDAIFWSAKQSRAPIIIEETEEDDVEAENTSLSSASSANVVNEKLEKKISDFSSEFVCSPSKLLCLFEQIATEAFPKHQLHFDFDGAYVIGMVGYPNVGKSMTINRLLGTKKTAVSSTPGKTKHFQTLIINDRITLCDCPGLVMPQFGLSDAEMLLNGILPIAHMRDHYAPIQLLCNRIPRFCFQQRYSILLPTPRQERNGIAALSAHDLLTAVAFLKGFMSASGIPDCSRAARLVLSDVIEGSLKWIAAPPSVPQETFNQWTFATMTKSKAHQQSQDRPENRQIGANLLEQMERKKLLLNGGPMNKNIDKTFFAPRAHTKRGIDMMHIQGGIMQLSLSEGAAGGKKRHWNKNKREKLRRVFASET